MTQTRRDRKAKRHRNKRTYTEQDGLKMDISGSGNTVKRKHKNAEIWTTRRIFTNKLFVIQAVIQEQTQRAKPTVEKRKKKKRNAGTGQINTAEERKCWTGKRKTEGRRRSKQR